MNDPDDMNRLSRRGFAARLACLGLALPTIAVGTKGAMQHLGGSAPVPVAAGVPPALMARALDALARHHARFWSRDMIAIADFGRPSGEPRFHFVDVLAGRTTTLLVAHGRGSDPDHSGWLQRFSAVVGSEATSRGAYLTGEPYVSEHGRSRRLIGLDPDSVTAEERAIVIHAAWYVGPEIVAAQGRCGRSQGCFAVAPSDLDFVLGRLGRGRLLYADKA